ncbi:MAG: hypothetical protein Q7U54_03945 [Bacteroidales bacterium]|nr:hypothetical protein [Bacteroidales bacterium]
MNSNYLKGLRIMYFALAMGIVLFLLIAIFLIRSNGAFSETDLSITQRIPFLITIVVLTGASFIAYRIIIPPKLEAIKTLPTLDRKLTAWRVLYILQGALIEAPAFFATVLFLLLGVSVLLVWPITGIVLFLLSQPTREKLISEANLSSSEIREFDMME